MAATFEGYGVSQPVEKETPSPVSFDIGDRAYFFVNPHHLNGYPFTKEESLELEIANEGEIIAISTRIEKDKEGKTSRTTYTLRGLGSFIGSCTVTEKEIFSTEKEAIGYAAVNFRKRLDAYKKHVDCYETLLSRVPNG